MVVHPVRALALGLVLLGASASLQVAEAGNSAPVAPPAKSATKDQKANPPAPAARPSPQSNAASGAPTTTGTTTASKEQPPPVPAGATTTPAGKSAFTPATRTNPKTGHRVVVITNEDLERMFGPSSDEAAAAAAPPEGEPSGGETVEGGAKEQGSPSVDPAARMTDIQKELQRLQQKERHLKNPFLPPAQESDAERNAEKGMGANQRLQRTREQADRLKDELRKLQEKQQPAPNPPEQGGP